MKQFDIVGLGECLVDFLVADSGKDTQVNLEGFAGGAPANAMAAVARHGHEVSYICKVGRDALGSFLKDSLEKSGLDISGVVRGDELTTLAMVSLDDGGNRSFSFYRNQTADVMLQPYEVNKKLVENCEIFHFGSLSLTDEPARSTTLQAAEMARKAGAKISYDPNYRDFLWDDEELAIETMKKGLELADFLKVSEEEAEMLSGETDPEKAALSFLTNYQLAFVAVTLGEAGCVGFSRQARVKMPTYKVKVVDTTGAGDAYWGAALHKLLQLEDGAPLDEARMVDLVQFANAAGSLTTTRYGGIPALPTTQEVEELVRTGTLQSD